MTPRSLSKRTPRQPNARAPAPSRPRAAASGTPAPSPSSRPAPGSAARAPLGPRVPPALLPSRAANFSGGGGLDCRWVPGSRALIAPSPRTELACAPAGPGAAAPGRVSGRRGRRKGAVPGRAGGNVARPGGADGAIAGPSRGRREPQSPVSGRDRSATLCGTPFPRHRGQLTPSGGRGSRPPGTRRGWGGPATAQALPLGPAGPHPSRRSDSGSRTSCGEPRTRETPWEEAAGIGAMGVRAV